VCKISTEAKVEHFFVIQQQRVLRVSEQQLLHKTTFNIQNEKAT